MCSPGSPSDSARSRAACRPTPSSSVRSASSRRSRFRSRGAEKPYLLASEVSSNHCSSESLSDAVTWYDISRYPMPICYGTEGHHTASATRRRRNRFLLDWVVRLRVPLCLDATLWPPLELLVGLRLRVVGEGKLLSTVAPENRIAGKPIFYQPNDGHLLSATTVEDETLLSRGVVLHSFVPFRFAGYRFPPPAVQPPTTKRQAQRQVGST